MPKAFAALKPNGEFVRIRVVFDPGSEHYFIAYQLSKKPRLYMPFGGGWHAYERKEVAEMALVTMAEKRGFPAWGAHRARLLKEQKKEQKKERTASAATDTALTASRD